MCVGVSTTCRFGGVETPDCVMSNARGSWCSPRPTRRLAGGRGGTCGGSRLAFTVSTLVSNR